MLLDSVALGDKRLLSRKYRDMYNKEFINSPGSITWEEICWYLHSINNRAFKHINVVVKCEENGEIIGYRIVYYSEMHYGNWVALPIHKDEMQHSGSSIHDITLFLSKIVRGKVQHCESDAIARVLCRRGKRLGVHFDVDVATTYITEPFRKYCR